MISYEELKRRRAADKHKNEGGGEQPELSYEEIKWKRKGYTPEEARQALNSISTRLSSWERGYNALTTDYSDRFVDMTGSYKDKYLGETGNWLADYTARKSDVVAEADQLRRLVDQHRSILGTDANKILESLEGAAAGLDKMQQGYTTYNDFYGQFKDESEYASWQDVYFHTAAEAAADRQAWEKETREKIRTMPEGAERNKLEDKLRRYERGEGEWGTYSKFVEKGDPLEKTASAYQTGFTNSLMDRGVVALQDQEFLNLAERTAAAVHIPDAEEAARYDQLKYGGYEMVYPDHGQPYAVSKVDGAVMVLRDGEYVHPELLTGAYDYSDQLGIFLSVDTDEQMDSSATDVRSKARAQGRTLHWDLLKPEEILVYYGLLGQDPKSATAFLEQMQSTLNHRFQNGETENTVKAYREASGSEKWGMSVSTIPANLLSGAAGFVTIALDKLVRKKETDFYGRGFEGKHYSDAVRGERAKEFDAAMPNLNILGLSAGDIYQAGMSGLDSLATSYVPGGWALQGMGGGVDKGFELYKEGASNDQIFRGAVTTAAVEAAAEKLPFDQLNLLKGKDVIGWLDFALNVLKQGGIEYGEEFVTELANGVTDLLNRTSESDWAKLWEENDGNLLKVAGIVIGQAHEAGMSGFISGSGTAAAVGSVSAARSSANANRLGAAVKRDPAVLEQYKMQAKAMDPKLAKLADSITANSSNARVAELVRRTNEASREFAISESVKSLQRKGFSRQRANAIADAIAASLSGSELTARQQKYLRFADVDPRIRETMQEAAMGSGSTAGKSNPQPSRFRESVDQGLAKAAAATGAQITTAKTDDAKTAADAAASTEITSIGMARAHTADGAQTGAVFPSDAQTGTQPGSVEQQTESRSKTTQDILLQAESIIGTQSLSKGEQDALYRYQQQSARLDALKQQRAALQQQLRTGTRLDVSAAREIQGQISTLDAEIAKADAALYAAKNSKQLSGVKQKVNAVQEQKAPDAQRNDLGNEPVNIELKFKPGWTAEQRAQAEWKLKMLSEAYTVKRKVERGKASARKRFIAEFGEDSITDEYDIDHVIDLQLGGVDDIINMRPLDRSVNRSLGAQVAHAIQDYSEDTVLGTFTIH